MKEPLGHKLARKMLAFGEWAGAGRNASRGIPIDGDIIKKELDVLKNPFDGGSPADVGLDRFVYAPKGIKAFFTTRRVGFSQPPYESLNLGYHVGDDPEAVRQNREILCSVLGVEPARLTVPRQRHTTEIRLVDDVTKVGTASANEDSWFDPCDGLITRMKKVPLMLLFADCVPLILMVGGQEPLVGVIHAGRQGLMDGIVTSAVKTIVDLGCEPASIIGAIGAAIGPCCYEVDEDTAGRFADLFGSDLVSENRLDLVGAVKRELIRAGLDDANIAAIGWCTSCDDRFFSYRRDGVTGRQGAIAWIE